MSIEDLMRAAAVVAAGLILLWPKVKEALSFAWGKVSPASSSTNGDTSQDLRIVLDLALRLKTAGNKEGADLCQKLIDVILRSAK